MMDNNEGDRNINGSCAPIDTIDLTNESPVRETVIKVTQSHKRRLQNIVANDDNIIINLTDTSPESLRNQTYRSVSCSSKTKSIPVSTHTRIEHNNVTKHTKDIVILEDTICISDDDKHYVTKSDNGESLSLRCPICFESLNSKLKPTTTRCGHIFCAQCLNTHLLTSKKCPSCNSIITLNSCTRLFL